MKKNVNNILVRLGWCDFVHKKGKQNNFFNSFFSNVVVKINFKVHQRLFIGFDLVPCLFFFGIIFDQKWRFHRTKKSILSWNIRPGIIFGGTLYLRRRQALHFIFYLWVFNFGKGYFFSGFSKKPFDTFGNFLFGVKNTAVFSESRSYLLDFSELFRDFGFDVCLGLGFSSKPKNIMFISSFLVPLKT